MQLQSSAGDVNWYNTRIRDHNAEKACKHVFSDDGCSLRCSINCCISIWRHKTQRVSLTRITSATARCRRSMPYIAGNGFCCTGQTYSPKRTFTAITKLFRIVNNEIIHDCCSYFKFSLPSELSEKRRVKFKFQILFMQCTGVLQYCGIKAWYVNVHLS